MVAATAAPVVTAVGAWLVAAALVPGAGSRPPVGARGGDEPRVAHVARDRWVGHPLSAPVTSPASATARRSSDAAESELELLVEIPRDVRVTARPGGGRTIGTVPADSPYFGSPTVAWVQRVSADGRHGRVTVPYRDRPRSGWIPLRGLERQRTPVEVRISLAHRRIDVERRGRLVLRAPVATGRSGSPTPRGRYFVTDLVRRPGDALGTFAFGLSGVQPRLPPGWSGGEQLAIHGTDDPSSIGRAVSAGCVRVDERTLDRLRALLGPGTPVIIGR